MRAAAFRTSRPAECRLRLMIGYDITSITTCARFGITLLRLALAPSWPAGPDTLLTVQEVADLLRVPPSWVYEHTRPTCRDPLPTIKLGKYLRFIASDVLAYVESTRGRRANRKP